jgi:hypothetical protein
MAEFGLKLFERIKRNISFEDKNEIYKNISATVVSLPGMTKPQNVSYVQMKG